MSGEVRILERREKKGKNETSKEMMVLLNET